MANALSDGAQGNAALVVEGPPGAGKSALMMQFVEEMRHLPNAERGERRWLPVILAGAEAECPGRIADAVDHAIGRWLAFGLAGRIRTGAACAGRPQHLSAYLNGALSGLKERAGAGDEVSSARGASLRSAIALGDEARRDYYRRRLQNLDRDNQGTGGMEWAWCDGCADRINRCRSMSTAYRTRRALPS